MRSRASLYRTLILACAWAFAFAVHGQESDVDDDCSGELVDQSCLDRESAFELRAKSEYLLDQLKPIVDPPWDQGRFSAARQAYDDAVSKYAAKEFAEAKELFTTAFREFTESKSTLELAVESLRTESREHLDSDRYSEAILLLKRLEGWQVDPDEISQGLARASIGVDLRMAIDEIESQVDRGELSAARARLSEIPAGYWVNDVSQLKRRISELQSVRSFNSLMSDGVRYAENRQWSKAEQAFTDALRINPNSVAAQRELVRAQQEKKSKQLTEFRATFDEHMAAEQWVQAVSVLRAIQTISSNNVSTAAEIQQVQKYVDAESRVDAFLDPSVVLTDHSVRNEVRRFLRQTRSESFGDRIDQKLSQLRENFELETEPVVLVVHSDNRARVRIRPGRQLGSFKTRRLNVIPGTYTLVATRRGYHEKRVNITLRAGDEPQSVRIQCDERF